MAPKNDAIYQNGTAFSISRCRQGRYVIYKALAALGREGVSGRGGGGGGGGRGRDPPSICPVQPALCNEPGRSGARPGRRPLLVQLLAELLAELLAAGYLINIGGGDWPASPRHKASIVALCGRRRVAADHKGPSAPGCAVVLAARQAVDGDGRGQPGRPRCHSDVPASQITISERRMK